MSVNVVDFYSEHYNLIDHMDRHYYKAFEPAHLRDWKKLFVIIYHASRWM